MEYCQQGNMTTQAKDLINILSYNDVSTLFVWASFYDRIFSFYISDIRIQMSGF